MDYTRNIFDHNNIERISISLYTYKQFRETKCRNERAIKNTNRSNKRASSVIYRKRKRNTK